jgi:tRNA (guanine-N7-)-methyltransferase
VGADRPDSDAQVSFRALKPPPDRLYGRGRGHALRPRQQKLMAETLPRIALPAPLAHDPIAAFPQPVRELWLEIGFGGGEHALAQSAAHPEVGLIACEVYENGICSLLSRLAPPGGETSATLPDNLRLWPNDARALLTALPDAVLDRMFLLYPDPWPKARHAKRRFVHPMLLPTLGRVMKPGGVWQIASDEPRYQAWVEEVMSGQELFTAFGAMLERPPDWPSTRYEAKALREGRSPLYWRFVRR